MPALTVGSRVQVFNGTADHTKSGLKKSDLKQNKHGEIVSKSKSKNATGNEWSKAIKYAALKMPKSQRADGIANGKIAKEAKKHYNKKTHEFSPNHHA
jgi:hypothetical protein